MANSEKEILNIGKEDIRNFIIVDKEENKYKADLTSMEKVGLSGRITEEITAIVREYLTENPLNNEINSDMIRTISFFIKFNIKPNLNNIKNFVELKEDPSLFSEDFKILQNCK